MVVQNLIAALILSQNSDLRFRFRSDKEALLKNLATSLEESDCHLSDQANEMFPGSFAYDEDEIITDDYLGLLRELNVDPEQDDGLAPLMTYLDKIFGLGLGLENDFVDDARLSRYASMLLVPELVSMKSKLEIYSEHFIDNDSAQIEQGLNEALSNLGENCLEMIFSEQEINGHLLRVLADMPEIKFKQEYWDTLAEVIADEHNPDMVRYFAAKALSKMRIPENLKLGIEHVEFLETLSKDEQYTSAHTYYVVKALANFSSISEAAAEQLLDWQDPSPMWFSYGSVILKKALQKNVGLHNFVLNQLCDGIRQAESGWQLDNLALFLFSMNLQPTQVLNAYEDLTSDLLADDILRRKAMILLPVIARAEEIAQSEAVTGLTPLNYRDKARLEQLKRELNFMEKTWFDFISSDLTEYSKMRHFLTVGPLGLTYLDKLCDKLDPDSFCLSDWAELVQRSSCSIASLEAQYIDKPTRELQLPECDFLLWRLCSPLINEEEQRLDLLKEFWDRLDLRIVGKSLRGKIDHALNPELTLSSYN